MDILNSLNRLRQFSFDQTVDQEAAEPAHGEPVDYGLRGSKPNYPLNSVAGRRMAGQGLAGAIVGEIAPHAVEPIRRAIQPAFNHVIGETFGMTPNVAATGSRDVFPGSRIGGGGR